MPCPAIIGLNLPAVIYSQSVMEFVDSSNGLMNVYSLSINGPLSGPPNTAIFITVQVNPITLETAINISAQNAEVEVVGAGETNPSFKIKLPRTGVYNYNYTVQSSNEAGVCSDSITDATFQVVQGPAPSAPIGDSICDPSLVNTGDCIKDFIKFRTLRCEGEEFTPSKSELYFEDLEGISLQRIGDITTDKYKGVMDLMNSRMEFAIKLMMDELMIKMPDNKFKPAIQTYRFGRFTKQYHSFESKYRGLLLKKQYTPLSYFLIEGLTLKSNTNKIGHEVKIFEGSLDSPINLKIYLVDLIAGEQTYLKISHKAYSSHVYVVSDNTDVLMNDSNITGDCDGCGGHWKQCYGYDYHITQGFDGVQSSGNTFGIKVDYSIRCDKQLLFCKLAMENKIAVLYRVGVEILKEWLSGDRLTFVSIYSEEWAIAKMEEWKELSNYYLEASMDGMTDYLTNLDCMCLPCQGNRIATIMP